jgi:preprotein translocase subunit SecF
MFVVRNRKIFYTISVILLAMSVAAVGIFGLRLGIDFKGGSIIEVIYPDGRPDVAEVRTALQSLDVSESIRPTGDDGFIIRMRNISEEEHASVLSILSQSESVRLEEKRFDSIGPVLGKEAAQKSIISIALVIIAIVLYITYAFRHVSEPVSSWKYGLIAIVALAHDVLIPTGVFAVLGYIAGVEVDTLFVTALLVILGFSVHDTIVVFDRVRENLKTAGGLAHKKFGDIVGASINETFTRSITTSLTTLFALFVLYFIGPEATKMFSLALIIGIAAGTYSSLFIGSPLLVTFQSTDVKK